MYQSNYLEQERSTPEKMNLFQQIGNLFFSPSKLFLFIKNKPKVLLPAVLISIEAVLVQLLLWEPTKDYSMDLLYSTNKSMGINMTPAEIEQLVNGSMIFGVAASPITYLAAWLIGTLVLYLIFGLVKREKGMKKYFSMTGFIMVISLLGMLIHSAFIYFTGASTDIATITSLASLLDPGLKGTFLYALALQIEVFTLWAYVLYGVGFVYTGGVEKKKSYLITAILAVIIILAGAGFSVISAGLQDSLLGGMGSF